MTNISLDWASLSEIVNLLLALALLYLRGQQQVAAKKAAVAHERADQAAVKVEDLQQTVDGLPIRGGQRGRDWYVEVTRCMELVQGHERRLAALEATAVENILGPSDERGDA